MSVLALAKLLSYAGLALLLGGAVMRRTRLSTVPLGWLGSGAALLLLGAGLEIGSTLIDLGFTAPSDVADFLGTTRTGQAALLRLIGAALLLAAELQSAERERGWRWLSLIGAGLLLWGVASAGHAGEKGGGWLLLDAVHAGAAAVWVGGVLGLARAAWERRPPTPDTVRRFTGLALSCIGVLTLSGVAALLSDVPLAFLWPALWGSSWGVTLLIKLGVLGAALLSSIWVRRALYGHGRALYARPAPSRAHPLLLESALLLGVLGASGALATTPPPSTAQIQTQTTPVSVRLAGQLLSGQLVLSGSGDVELTLRPALPDVSAKLIMTDHPMPEQALPLETAGGALQGQTRLWMSGTLALGAVSGHSANAADVSVLTVSAERSHAAPRLLAGPAALHAKWEAPAPPRPVPSWPPIPTSAPERSDCQKPVQAALEASGPDSKRQARAALRSL